MTCSKEMPDHTAFFNLMIAPGLTQWRFDENREVIMSGLLKLDGILQVLKWLDSIGIKHGYEVREFSLGVCVSCKPKEETSAERSPHWQLDNIESTECSSG